MKFTATSRFATLRAAAAIAALCASPAALGQTNIQTIPVGQTRTFSITQPFTDCTTTGAANSTNPAVATVTPGGNFTFSGFLQTFTVTGVSQGVAIVVYNFTGAGPDGQPDGCSSGSGTYNVSVVPATSPLTGGNVSNGGAYGEPISAATGELFTHGDTPDLVVDGPLPVAFTRYYAAFLSAPGNGAASALGTNWMHNYDLKIAASGTTATVTLFRGKTVQFTQSGGAWKLASTEKVPFQLQSVSGGFQFLDPAVQRIYSFNAPGALTSIQDRKGNTLTVTPGPNGPIQISDGLGRTLTFTYNGTNLTQVQDQSGRIVSFTYSSGLLSAWTDANGKRTTFTYVSQGGLNGLLQTETRPLGNQPFTQQFDSQGRVSTQLTSYSNPVNVTYNNSGGATFADASGPTLTFAESQQLNLTSITDTAGVSTKLGYDANNRVTSVTDRTGAKTSTTYDAASGLPATYTDQLGDVTTYTYAASPWAGFTVYDLTAIVYSDGSKAKYGRDANGNITSYTDPNGNVWQYAWNSRGQLTSATNPLGGPASLTYAPDGTLTGVQLPSGDTTKVAYDTAKRPALITHPDGTTAALQYDALDHLVKKTDERQNSRIWAYDDNGNLKSVADALGALTGLGFDTQDNHITTTDPSGKVSKIAWDSLGRFQSATDATGVSVTYSYDKLNHLTGAVDTAGKGATYVTDAEGRIVSSTDALNRTMKYVRDAKGELTGITTPKSEQYTLTFDARGRVVSGTDPLGRIRRYAYEPSGRIAQTTLPGQVAASFTRDAAGDLVAITDPNGNVWSRTFDSSRRQTSMTDPLGATTKLEYTSRQQISRSVFPLGTAQYTYDATSNPTGIAYSDGTSLSYAYDADNRVTSGSGISLTRDPNGRITGSNGLQIARDAAGRIASVTYGSGKTVKYTYDNRGLLTQVSDWVGGSTALSYDAMHQLTSMVFANGVREDYTYDADGRRITIAVSNAGKTISSITLHRDAAGQIVATDRSSSPVPSPISGYSSFAYDAAGQSVGATYDTLGRVTGDSLHTYTWDLASRLTSWKTLNTTASFTYDAFGQRISKSINGTAENYVLNYALPLPSVSTVQSSGADQRYYVWLPNGMLMEAIDAAGSKRHFYHYDESGSTNLLTDDSGAVTDSYALTPYGESVAQTGSTPNPFTFHGAYGVIQEDGTRLYYMRQRYYDASSAHFLSRDPAPSLDPRAIAPYVFAAGNPIDNHDPSGRLFEGSLFFDTILGGGDTSGPPPPPSEPSRTAKELEDFFDAMNSPGRVSSPSSPGAPPAVPGQPPSAPGPANAPGGQQNPPAAPQNGAPNQPGNPPVSPSDTPPAEPGGTSGQPQSPPGDPAGQSVQPQPVQPPTGPMGPIVVDARGEDPNAELKALNDRGLKELERDAENHSVSAKYASLAAVSLTLVLFPPLAVALIPFF